MNPRSRSFVMVVMIAIALACVASSAGTDSVTLVSSKDNTLYEDTLTFNSNGAGDNFFAGMTATGALRRGLVAFPVADSIPAGATITSVTLTLHLSRTNPFFGALATVELHKTLSEWGEGDSDAIGEEGAGILPDSGDATWVHTFFDTALWSNPGGDFSPGASASQAVDAFSVNDSLNFYTWTSTQMVADVQSWLDDPSSNFGWVVIGNESDLSLIKRFDTREDTMLLFHPRLHVEFTPTPTAVATSPPPASIHLHPGYPNPFGPATTIRYSIAEPGPVSLSIYDVRGRRVRSLVTGAQPAGTHSVSWNGRDEHGVRVSSGIYFVRLQRAGEVRRRRLVFLK